MKWNVLKDMQALYECGKIKRKPSFVDDPDVDHLINSTKELCVLRKEVIIPENSTFRQTYDKLLPNPLQQREVSKKPNADSYPYIRIIPQGFCLWRYL